MFIKAFFHPEAVETYTLKLSLVQKREDSLGRNCAPLTKGLRQTRSGEGPPQGPRISPFLRAGAAAGREARQSPPLALPSVQASPGGAVPLGTALSGVCPSCSLGALPAHSAPHSPHELLRLNPMAIILASSMFPTNFAKEVAG